MTEGVVAMLRRAFDEMGRERVFGTTYEENAGSRRVMAKAGISVSLPPGSFGPTLRGSCTKTDTNSTFLSATSRKPSRSSAAIAS